MLPCRFLLFLILLFLYNPVGGIAYAQSGRYNEEINIVSNYTYTNFGDNETLTIPELLKKEVQGFIFKLVLGSDTNSIDIISPHNTKIDFATICDHLHRYCAEDTSHVITLFFDYDFDSDLLVNFLKKQKCYDNIWKQMPDAECPTISSLVSAEEQLMCFTLNDGSGHSPIVKNFWDYAAKPCFTNHIEPTINGEFCRGTLKNNLLFLTSFSFAENNTVANFPFNLNNINENPFFVGHSINLWKNTGKKPNFIVFNKYHGVFNALRSHLNRQISISGTISYNRKPLDRVFWEGDFISVSHGQYCFPATPHENVALKPQTPGFRFVPEEISVKELSENMVRNFIAIPLDLQTNLVAYFPFNDKMDDQGPMKLKVDNQGAKLVGDGNRNGVAEFDGHSFITLPKANAVGISNSDFTVSAWVKLARDNNNIKRDFSVMGTEESYYRGGLHLQIRNNKTYFGFYSNDLSGTTELAPNRWYHVVWRYIKYNQEQAIFVNGKADGASLNHPAFISNSNLYIGKSISQDNLFEGRIDDLIIWNRALGEEEIWNLYQDVSLIDNNSIINYLKRNKFWLGGLLFLVTLVVLALSKKKNKISPKTIFNDIHPIEITDRAPTKNAVKLFGNFQVLDKTGLDITHQFTPRLKQIFIYLIIKSKSAPQGLSSEEFINAIWPSFDRKNAINNRGVSINKLRSVLESMDTIHIYNHQERWKLEVSDNVYCDYHYCFDKLNNKLLGDRDKLNSFLSIVQRGAFLSDCNDSCFDEIKGICSNEVIDVLTHMLSDLDWNQNPGMMIKIADRILAADDMNEDALRYKIKALMALRQNNQAKFLYKSFKEKYEDILDQKFPTTFEEIIR